VYRRKRIVGGTKAVLGEFPWQVSLQFRECDNPFCGGIILDEVTILSASSCLYSKRSQLF
jgi:secreted trypsin-like serine protease